MAAPVAEPVAASEGPIFATVELDSDEPSEPECKFLVWPENGFRGRRVSALEFLEQLPAATCSVEGVPEALEVLRETTVSVSLPVADYSGLMQGLALASGLWLDELGTESGSRFLTQEP